MNHECENNSLPYGVRIRHAYSPNKWDMLIKAESHFVEDSGNQVSIKSTSILRITHCPFCGKNLAEEAKEG